MRRLYKLFYLLGFTPWERMASHPVADQIATLFDREEEGLDPPRGLALDLGCGSGIWTVRLAQRGWSVTGVELIAKPLAAARERARAASVEVRFLQGDISELGRAGVGSGFDLIVDFGAVHGLTAEQRRATGRGVTAAAREGARLLMFAFAPGRRGPMPRGMSREDVAATYPGWSIVDERKMTTAGAPRPIQRAEPRWYRLVRD